MDNTFGNLGDFFPAQKIKCRVHGCDHEFEISGEEAIAKLANGKSIRVERMCDECYARLQTLLDQEMPCSTPGCEGKWTWNRYQQLEAYARAKGEKPKPPLGLCDVCREKLKDFKPQTLPCRNKHCKNTWTWSAREQFLAQGKPAPHRLCDECFKKFNELKDITLPCRVHGCTGTSLWSRTQQLEQWRTGKSLEKPPQRMCSECFKVFLTLKDEQRPCKIRGCTNTWTYTAYEQLERLRKTPEGETPKPVQRMCKDCFEFFNNAKDIEQPCKNPNCTNTWIWTRAAQLILHVQGNDETPKHFCAECHKKFLAAQAAKAAEKAAKKAEEAARNAAAEPAKLEDMPPAASGNATPAMQPVVEPTISVTAPETTEPAVSVAPEPTEPTANTASSSESTITQQ